MLEPRSVADFLVNFRRALDHQFYLEDPGRPDVFHYAGDFVGPNNKRRVVFYVAHGPLETARRLTRVDYVMPVGPIHAVLLFGGDGETTMSATGPDFSVIDVPEGQTAEATVAAEIAATAMLPAPQRLALWEAEIARITDMRDNPDETLPRRQTASNILRFWDQMRRDILAILFVNVQGPGVALAPPAAPPLPMIDAGPVAHVATSSSERRRRRDSARRRSRNANAARRTTRRATSDPDNGLGYTRDPVTGKLTRRRRPNSDPK